MIRLLSRAFDITALCFYRGSDRPTRAAVDAGVAGLSRFAHVEAFPIPQEQGRARLLWDHLRSVATGRVYTRYAYESRAFRRRVLELRQSRRFDLAHIDSLDLSGYLPLLRDLPTVCVHHNVESVLLRRRAAVEDVKWRGAYVAHQATLLEREERTWCQRVALNTVVSPGDRATLEAIAPRARVAVVPNGVDTQHFHAGRGMSDGVIFVGGSNWFPNRDALFHYADDILPLLRARVGRVRTRWVGHAEPDLRERVARDYGIDMTGYVADVRPYVRDGACFVVPLRVGGGTRVKILDAWAMGKAVVTTSAGCEGLSAEDGVNALVRDTPEDFAAAVADVLADAALRERLGRGGRATVERLYAWDVIGDRMIDRYLGLIGRERGMSASPAATGVARTGDVA